jgi:hypothetical protein
MKLIDKHVDPILNKMVTTKNFDVLFKVIEIDPNNRCWGFDLCSDSKYTYKKREDIIECNGILIEKLLGDEELRIVLANQLSTSSSGVAMLLNVSDRTVFRLMEKYEKAKIVG